MEKFVTLCCCKVQELKSWLVSADILGKLLLYEFQLLLLGRVYKSIIINHKYSFHSSSVSVNQTLH